MTYRLRNFTPHSVTVMRDMTLASEGVARIATTETVLSEHWMTDASNLAIGPVPVIRQVYGEVTGLPPAASGVLLIVSAMVRSACPKRDDLVSPARLTRDETGAITGAMALEVQTSMPHYAFCPRCGAGQGGARTDICVC